MATQRVILLCVFAMSMIFAGAQQDPSAECFIKLASEPRFAPLSGKMAIGAPPKSTFAMLADESFPTDADRQLIADWATAVTLSFRDIQKMMLERGVEVCAPQ